MRDTPTRLHERTRALLYLSVRSGVPRLSNLNPFLPTLKWRFTACVLAQSMCLGFWHLGGHIGLPSSDEPPPLRMHAPAMLRWHARRVRSLQYQCVHGVTRRTRPRLPRGIQLGSLPRILLLLLWLALLISASCAAAPPIRYQYCHCHAHAAPSRRREDTGQDRIVCLAVACRTSSRSIALVPAR